MFKLQISCIVIMLFLFVLFLAESKIKKTTQKLFLGILVVSIFQVLSEILIIHTIQNVENVSPITFKIVQRTYLTLVLTFFYLSFRYMSAFIKEEVGEPAKSLSFIHVAQVILYAGIFLLPLGYEKTETAVAFSGAGVWVVYIGAAFYLFIIFSNFCGQIRRIAAEKILPLVLGVAFGMCACFYYMIVPTAYLSCLGAVIMNMAFFLAIRSPQQCCVDGNDVSEDAEDQKGVLSYKVSYEAPEARILVVDDSEMNRKVIRNLLKKTKVQIDEAAGGKECIERVKQNTYHMIFMDHLMPEMDGLETFDILRDKKLIDGTPVVVMTANTVSMTEKDYMDYGFSAYMGKPIIPERPEAVVYELLDKSLVTVLEKTEIINEPNKIADGNAKEAKEADSTSGQNWDKLPPLDGLDYTYAALHFQDTDEFEEMVNFLLAVIKPDMEEVEGYYSRIDDAETLNNFKTKVHSMKNSAMTIGIVPLAGLAKTLEDAACEENRDMIDALMPVFAERWEKYRLLLYKTFAVNDENKISADPQSPEIKALFDSLREAAAEMDIDALDELMEEIDGYAFGPEYEDKLQKIRLAVTNFEVEYLQEEGFL